ncbi:class I SAM-dependent methyltransferase [Spirosoma taeanense]|uniref:Class I SAM-dependent methyltransferase n=1 Tax=Spirosoma taeanense TaxID=2735870 RepID=A0A6M5Y6P6_9BACT|nr:class I SAM-dependent methyltransferase [Spirosoma taeanense]QJW89086.1 class I SAM-dependent methyltransferase [Spirosoma taeanense]
MILAYLRYLSRARDEHSLHSPFLFSLYTTSIRPDNRREPAFTSFRALRNELCRSRETIAITDFGAGSKVNGARQRTIGDIACHSQKPARFGRLLFRLIRHAKANVIVDLGTSLGLTTAYLAEAARPQHGQVLTFEGCPQTAAVARQNFDRLGTPNVEIVVGNLDETLASRVARLKPIDFVFFDANHRYEPTVRYFEICLSNSHNDTLFVFDDIHWSDEMEQAWAYIKRHPAVSVTVDLFWVGLVFTRKEQPKQDFVLRF